MDPRELIKVGKIVGTHGYKGSVKVQLLTDFPDRFQPGQKYLVLRAKEALELTLTSARPHGGMMLMQPRALTIWRQPNNCATCSMTTDQLYPLRKAVSIIFSL